MLGNAHRESTPHPPRASSLHRHIGNEALETGKRREDEAESPHAHMAEHNAPEVDPSQVGQQQNHNQVLTEQIAVKDRVSQIVHRRAWRHGDREHFEKECLEITDKNWDLPRQYP